MEKLSRLVRLLILSNAFHYANIARTWSKHSHAAQGAEKIPVSLGFSIFSVIVHLSVRFVSRPRSPHMSPKERTLYLQKHKFCAKRYSIKLVIFR